METEEILFVKVTPPPSSRPDEAQTQEPWYIYVPNRETVEAQIVECYRNYSKGTKIEVLECTVKHCTKADVVVNW